MKSLSPSVHVGKIHVGLEHRLNKNASNARTSFAFTVATHDETHEFIIYISSGDASGRFATTSGEDVSQPFVEFRNNLEFGELCIGI